LIEAVELAKKILQHYVKPFTFTSSDDLNTHINKLDRP